MKAIRMQSFGGPEVLKLEEVPVPEPAEGQVRVRAQAIGVNFMDTRMRAGARPTPLPGGIGFEAVGLVDAIGKGVAGYRVGERVAYYLGPAGAYAEQHCASAQQLVRVPEEIPAEIAVSLLMKAVTAQYLIRRAYPVKRGEKMLVHAAAGGVGLTLSQWGKSIGATVVGAVGSEEKIKVALANGCDHVVSTRDPNWAQKVRELTGGVDVVYDSVGKDTFEGSLDALKIRGTLVCFGSSSGPPPPIDIMALGAKGSFKVMYANGFHFSSNKAEIEEAFADVVATYQAGGIKPIIHQILPLKDAAKAHEALGNRQTIGGIVLTP